jgi:hypothetical protein
LFHDSFPFGRRTHVRSFGEAAQFEGQEPVAFWRAGNTPFAAFFLVS